MDAEGLSLLLRAPSQEAVANFFNACFRHRHDATELASTPACAAFGLPPAEAAKLSSAGVSAVREVLYHSADVMAAGGGAAAAVAEAVAATLPPELDARLKALIGKVMAASLPLWRSAAMDSRVSLPALEGVAWRVDVLNASAEAGATNEPTVSLRLRVRDNATRADALPAAHDVMVGLNAASLGALVDGMRRIKDQLAGIQ